jgi:hypothetical protein
MRTGGESNVNDNGKLTIGKKSDDEREEETKKRISWEKSYL